MFWISKRRHAERVRVVQRRLARVKGERDVVTAEAASAVIDAIQLADRVESQRGRIAELEREVAAERGRAERFGADLDRAMVEVRELRRIRTLLEDALDYYTAAVAQPVHVLIRDACLHSIHRSKEAAGLAVRQADPTVPDLMTWTPREGADPTVGWWHAARTLPPLPDPPQAAAIEAYYRALEARKPAALPPASAGERGPQASKALAVGR